MGLRIGVSRGPSTAASKRRWPLAGDDRKTAVLALHAAG